MLIFTLLVRMQWTLLKIKDEVVEMSDDVIEEESSSYENDREELFCSYERNRISG